MDALIKKTIVILCCVVGFSVNSQNLDSLLQELPKMQEDTNKVNTLYAIVKAYIFTDILQQAKYLEQMLQLSKKNHYHKGEARAYLAYSDHYLRINKPDKSFAFILKADSICKPGYYEKGIPIVYNLTGRYYLAKEKYKEALVQFQKAVSYYEKTNNKKLLAANLSIVSNLFFNLKRYRDAESYKLKVIALYKEINDLRSVSIEMSNLASLYIEDGKYDKAKQYFNLSLNLQEQFKDDLIIAKIQRGKSLILSSKKRYSEALKMLEQSFATFSNISDTLEMAYTKMHQAETYRMLKVYDKSIVCLDLALHLVQSINIGSATISKFYYKYYEVYKEMGDYKSALTYYEKVVENQNGLFSEKMQQIVSDLKEKYETKKKEQENKQLRQINEINTLKLKNNRYFLVGTGFLFILILVVFALIWRNNKIKSREKTLRLQQKLLISQMNPHFIFNSLNSIQNFIYKQDAQNAAIYLNHFSKLMRMILTFSRKEQVTLAEEKQLLERYLDIQKLRFGSKLEWEITTDETIDEENVLIQPMLAQPFIENSLEHGLFKTEEMGKISIHFKKKNNFLIFEIEDNGIGLNKTEKTAGHKSLATVITSERISSIKTLSGKNTTFDIINLRDIDSEKHGVKVVFKIPYETVL
jgi:tetratricopeptide (TPR) repeat protein